MTRPAPHPGPPAWVRLAARARWLLAACVVVVVGLVTAGTASAERVRTTRTTKVYKRTGEQSGVVTKVGKGKTLTVIATQGRWLKVRANGRTGWVTRSSVRSSEARGVPRNTRRRPFVDGRSTRRGWSGGAPDDRVGADAVDDDDDDDRGDDDDRDDRDDRRDRRAERDHRDRRAARDDHDRDDDLDDPDDDPDGEDGGDDAVRMVRVASRKARLYPRASERGQPVATVRRGDQLMVLDEHDSGDWYRVEDQDGDAGWIAADQVDEVDQRGPPRPRRVIAASARLGFASVGGTFNSNAPVVMGASPPADYTFGSTAVSLAVAGEVVYAARRDYYLGGGLEYLGCVATPGIRYTAGTMAEDIAFKTHDIDLRLVGGYDFHKASGMTAWARLGYHYGVFSVSNLDNLASIPAETFKGPTVGAALRIPRLTGKLGVEASLDVVYPGSRVQTTGNEDGDQAKARAAVAQLAGTYAWKGRWRLGAGYRLNYASTSWTGTSNRVSGATASSRRDLAHVLTVGAGRSF